MWIAELYSTIGFAISCNLVGNLFSGTSLLIFRVSRVLVIYRDLYFVCLLHHSVPPPPPFLFSFPFASFVTSDVDTLQDRGMNVGVHHTDPELRIQWRGREILLTSCWHTSIYQLSNLLLFPVWVIGGVEAYPSMHWARGRNTLWTSCQSIARTHTSFAHIYTEGQFNLQLARPACLSAVGGNWGAWGNPCEHVENMQNPSHKRPRLGIFVLRGSSPSFV